MPINVIDTEVSIIDTITNHSKPANSCMFSRTWSGLNIFLYIALVVHFCFEF